MNKTKSRIKRQKKSIVWEYFDNCLICQAMKEGRADTYEGLTAAFAEAKKRFPSGRVGFDL